MNADLAPSPSAPALALPGATRGDLFWLVLLLALAGGMRLWQVNNTEVTSRDSVMYIRFAWRLETEPWQQVVRTGVHHPGYGLLVYAFGGPMRAAFPDDLPFAMQLAAQLAAALCGVLLVVPMYYLGKELFDRRVGFWGALLFQCIPSSGRLMADGLSEPLFLLLASTALLFAVRALGTSRIRWFVLCGLATGLAYLTRQEGLLVVLVTLFVLAGLQFSPRWRQPRGRLIARGACLVLGCAVFAVPFMILIGGISLKVSAKHMLESEGWKMPEKALDTPRVSHVRSLLPLAKWKFGAGIGPQDRYLWAARTLVEMVDKAFFHVFLYPALAALWLFRRRFAEVPGMWLLFGCGLVLVPLLYKLGQSNGYISERHAILILLGGVFWSVAGIGWLAAWVAKRTTRVSAPTLSLVVLLVATGVCLPRTLARLHGNRDGFREVGVWLAENTKPGDEIYDPMTWTSYHAGRVFVEGRSDVPRSNPPVCYVVLEQSKSEHKQLWFILEPAKKLAARGKVYHSLTVHRGRETAEIQVFRVEGTP
jgi:Dolichyl-phosphate-mannose-protein mannosyltransferase